MYRMKQLPTVAMQTLRSPRLHGSSSHTSLPSRQGMRHRSKLPRTSSKLLYRASLSVAALQSVTLRVQSYNPQQHRKVGWHGCLNLDCTIVARHTLRQTDVTRYPTFGHIHGLDDPEGPCVEHEPSLDQRRRSCRHLLDEGALHGAACEAVAAVTDH